MSLKALYHSVATGSSERRRRMTPIGLAVFGATLVVVIAAGLMTDRLLGLPALLPGGPGVFIGIMLLIPGGGLLGWCVLRFARSHGTPVPFNPPKELIVSGAYLWVRNPMVTGIFTCLLGIGLMLHSLGMVLVWTPIYIVLHLIELKLVEEPELELRFGEAYKAYKRDVPMFIPNPWRRKQRRVDGG